MRKPGPPREIPPPLELECLKVLWSIGEANVKRVQEALLPERRLAYTTVMTVLDRLAKRGIAARRKMGRYFVYAPLVGREAMRRAAVRDLLETFFGGSEEQLLQYLSRRETVPQLAPSTETESLDPALL